MDDNGAGACRKRVSIPKTVSGGLQLSRACNRFFILSCFNTEDGIGRATTKKLSDQKLDEL